MWTFDILYITGFLHEFWLSIALNVYFLQKFFWLLDSWLLSFFDTSLNFVPHSTDPIPRVAAAHLGSLKAPPTTGLPRALPNQS